MKSPQHKLDVMLLASKKTYSLLKKKPVVEWKTAPYDSDAARLKFPHDFEIRLVKAAAAGKSLDKEFNELSLDWSASNDAKAAAKKLISGNGYLGCSGLTDVALYIENLGLAVIVESHASSPSIIEVDSIDALKKALD